MGNLLGSPITEKDTHVGATHDTEPDPSLSPDGGGLRYGISSMQGWRIHMEDAHITQPFLYAERPGTPVVAAASASAGGGESDAGTVEEIPDRKTAIEATLSNEEGGDDGVTTDVSVTPGARKDGTKSDAAVGGYLRIPLPNHSLFAVFDGHGGSFAAEYASRNLLRVLSRSGAFCDYAEKWRGRENFMKRTAEDLKRKKGAVSADLATSDGGDEVEAKGSPKTSNSDSIDDADFQVARATYDHELMTLLERSLRDAFINLDTEILRDVRGERVQDANTPYGVGYLSIGCLNEEAPGKGDDEDAMGVDDSEGTKPGGEPAGEADGGHPTPSDDEDAGTTAVVVVTTPRWIVCANAGDSRAVYSRSGHRAVPLSYDHKPDDEDEERRIREAGGYVSGGRVEGDLAVSRGLGDYRFKDIDAVLSGCWGEGVNRATTIMQRQLGGGNDGGGDVPMLKPSEQKVSPIPDIIVQNRDPKEDEFVVIACDGIWDVLTNQECVRMVADIFEEGEDNLGLVCEEILDLCLIKGSKDNMTAAVIKFPKQATGLGGGVVARRESRGLSSKDGNGEGKGEKEGEELRRTANRYVPPAQREGGSGSDGGGGAGE